MTKTCINAQCKQSNPQSVEAFSKLARGYKSRKCKSCRSPSLNKIAKKWRDTHPEQFRGVQRASRLKRCYGITMAQFNAMFEAQGGKCKICRLPEIQDDPKTKLCVDHNHDTEQLRGLLCYGCNAAIGLLRESPENLRRAIVYLELYSNDSARSKMSA